MWLGNLEKKVEKWWRKWHFAASETAAKVKLWLGERKKSSNRKQMPK